MTNYESRYEQLHEDILSTLRNDSTPFTFHLDEDTLNATTKLLSSTKTVTQSLSSISGEIIDGQPFDLIKGVGFTYVIVHTPEEEGEKKLTQTKRESHLVVHIEAYSKKERNARVWTDAILNALINATLPRSHGFYINKPTNRHIRTKKEYEQAYLKPVWKMNIYVPYLWTGSE